METFWATRKYVPIKEMHTLGTLLYVIGTIDSAQINNSVSIFRVQNREMIILPQ